jgi:hypothetical protein
MRVGLLLQVKWCSTTRASARSAPRRPSAGAWNGTVGLFNGNRPGENVNDNNRYLWAGRILWVPEALRDVERGDRLEVGLNAAWSDDRNVDLVASMVPEFAGERRLLGGDFRLARAGWLMSGEMIVGRLDPVEGGRIRPEGFQVTAGYRVTPRSQVLVRWDSFSPDGGSEAVESALALRELALRDSTGSSSATTSGPPVLPSSRPTTWFRPTAPASTRTRFCSICRSPSEQPR